MTDDQLTTYPVGQERDPFLAPALVDELAQVGVALPGSMTRTARHVRDLTSIMGRALDRPLPSDMVTMDEETLMAVIRQHAASAAVNRDIRRGIYQDLRTGLANQLADALAGAADDVVDQLREVGRTPAEAVHQAVQLGITTSTTEADILKRTNLADVAPAWNSLRGHAAALDHLAGLRLRLSAATGVPPLKGWDQTGRAGQLEYESTAKVAAFGLGERWQASREELTWQRWVRFSQAGPVLLASVDDAHAAMQARGTMIAASTVRQVPVPTPSKRDREIYEVM